MFSVPSTPHFSSNNENTNGALARKPGATPNISQRKALGDRGVNGPIFNTPRNLKPEIRPVEKVKVTLEEPKEDLFDYDYEISSFKEVEDNFIDICPMSQRLTRDGAIDILRWYCGELPSPSPDLSPVNILLEEIPEEKNFDDSSCSLEEISFDDVSLPETSFEDSGYFLDL